MTDTELFLLAKKKAGGGTPPVLTTKTITANGTYNASDDNADGYSSVSVEVEGGDNIFDNLISGTTLNGVKNITAVHIPNGITEISADAFNGIANLKSVDIPSSVTKIGGNAFNQTGLTSVQLPDTITSLASCFYGCTSLVSIRFSKNAIVTGCQNCTNLETVIIPNGAQTIAQYAFNKCTKLSSIDIPESVTTIERYAFQSCSSLASIICRGTTPPALGSNALQYVSPTAIYVPAESVDTYKATSGWSSYASVIQAIPS